MTMKEEIRMSKESIIWLTINIALLVALIFNCGYNNYLINSTIKLTTEGMEGLHKRIEVLEALEASQDNVNEAFKNHLNYLTDRISNLRR